MPIVRFRWATELLESILFSLGSLGGIGGGRYGASKCTSRRIRTIKTKEC